MPPLVALLAEGVDRNVLTPDSSTNQEVALLAEGVDRNSAAVVALHVLRVALLAEGVDRNQSDPLFPTEGKVALLAEGVDRNNTETTASREPYPSPSSQRAWIEIRSACRARRSSSVALLAEGVDRNPQGGVDGHRRGSRPPRRGRG